MRSLANRFFIDTELEVPIILCLDVSTSRIAGAIPGQTCLVRLVFAHHLGKQVNFAR